jgi:hypothetical protein
MKIDNVQIFGMLCGVYLGVCVPSSGRCLHFLPLTALFALFKPTDLFYTDQYSPRGNTKYSYFKDDQK